MRLCDDRRRKKSAMATHRGWWHGNENRERERAELLGKHDFRNQQIALSERRGKVFRKFLAERGG